MNSNRNIWVDYLRSSLTVLVVAHHSSLAYTTFAKFDKAVYINSTHPIVDAKRWIGLDIFENFNDVFFMSLMFLIGGLFLSRSISKKGKLKFIIDRFYRLFIPFLFLGTLAMLLAYFPSYYVGHGNTNIKAYVKDFFTTEQWPVGPPWFIWVLFLFNFLFVFVNPLIQKLKPGIVRFFDWSENNPFWFFSFLLLITWCLYVPMAYNVGAGTWVGIGPFDFQLSRIFLYFGYFLVGGMIGNTDFNQKIFSENSLIVKKWWLWSLLALIIYTALTIGAKPLRQMVASHELKAFSGWMIYYTIYVSSCALSSLAFISIFRRFIHSAKSLWTSLSDNAYLIYLVHFIFVIWMQFLLLPYNIPAFVKFAFTFVTAISISWALSSLLRRNKLLKKYL